MSIVAIFGIQYDINNLKTNLTSFYISLTGDTVKFLFRFKWLVKRGLGRPLFLFIPTHHIAVNLWTPRDPLLNFPSELLYAFKKNNSYFSRNYEEKINEGCTYYDLPGTTCTGRKPVDHRIIQQIFRKNDPGES